MTAPATPKPDPVRSKTSTTNATVFNASPARDTECAKNRRRNPGDERRRATTTPVSTLPVKPLDRALAGSVPFQIVATDGNPVPAGAQLTKLRTPSTTAPSRAAPVG